MTSEQRKEVVQFCRDNQQVIDLICDLFAKHNISPSVGEKACIIVAGMSRGHRAEELMTLLPFMAAAWAIAAEEG